MGTAPSLEPRMNRQFSHQQDAFLLFKWKHFSSVSALIFQKHHTLFRQLSGKSMMFFPVILISRCPAFFGIQCKGDVAKDRSIQFSLRDFTRFQKLFHPLCDPLLRFSRHLQSQSVTDRISQIVCRIAIRYHHALISPLLPKKVKQH